MHFGTHWKICTLSCGFKELLNSSWKILFLLTPPCFEFSSCCSNVEVYSTLCRYIVTSLLGVVWLCIAHLFLSFSFAGRKNCLLQCQRRRKYNLILLLSYSLCAVRDASSEIQHYKQPISSPPEIITMSTNLIVDFVDSP